MFTCGRRCLVRLKHFFPMKRGTYSLQKIKYPKQYSFFLTQPVKNKVIFNIQDYTLYRGKKLSHRHTVL